MSHHTFPHPPEPTSQSPALQAEDEKRRKGEAVDPNAFDSNCITPGTPFMDRLGTNLRFFIRKKKAEDPLWQGPTIIFSGVCAPLGRGSEGEGRCHARALCSRAPVHHIPWRRPRRARRGRAQDHGVHPLGEAPGTWAWGERKARG